MSLCMLPLPLTSLRSHTIIKIFHPLIYAPWLIFSKKKIMVCKEIKVLDICKYAKSQTQGNPWIVLIEEPHVVLSIPTMFTHFNSLSFLKNISLIQSDAILIKWWIMPVLNINNAFLKRCFGVTHLVIQHHIYIIPSFAQISIISLQHDFQSPMMILSFTNKWNNTN